MYINHASPVGAYEYLNDGTAPTLFGGMGDNGGLGIVGTDVYSSSVTNGNVYKTALSTFPVSVHSHGLRLIQQN